MKIKNLKTQIALWESIEHWFENWSDPKFSETGGCYCALCDLFVGRIYIDDCIGCPVFEKTGRQYCENTPWHDAHHERIHGYFGKETKLAYKKEYQFLVDLAFDDALNKGK